MEHSHILKNLKRSDKVYFFYRKYDTHGFACSYIFRSFFKENDLLNILNIVPTIYNEVLDCDRDSYVFLCDVDLTSTMIFSLCNKVKKVFVIDSKFSTVQNIKVLYKTELEESMKFNNLFFIEEEKTSPVSLVWDLVFPNKDKPNFVTDLNLSYLVESSLNKDANNFYKLKFIPNEYSVWDVVTEKDNYSDYQLSELYSNAAYIQAKNICLRNSTPYALGNFKTMIINSNREIMDEVGCLAIMIVDIAVVYEKTAEGYFYSLYSSSGTNVNFLRMFRDYNCRGFHKRAWFESSNFIFKPRKSLLTKIRELF